MGVDSGGSRGRGNGLEAAAYVPLADLDPRLAEALLGALRDAGIAGYATPSTGRRGGYLEVQLPSSPLEQVWVDAAAEPAARHVLAGLGAEGAQPQGSGEPAGPQPPPPAAGAPAAAPPPAPTEEERWAAIVAMFDAAPVGPVPPWPAAEDVPAPPGPRLLRRGDPPAGPDTPPAAAPPRGTAPPSRGSVRVPPAGSGGPGRASTPRGPRPAGDPDDHFVPPPPPPLPRTTPATRYGLLALLGGILVLVVPTLLGSPPSAFVAFLAVVSVLGGFVSLVMRMRDAPPTDSGPDDGAVV